MSFDRTDKCFFTQKRVISNDELDGTCLDGYYYRFEYNGTIREIRLDTYTDWKNNEWVKQYGPKFIELIEKHNQWSFFEKAHNIKEVEEYYYMLVKSNN